jgi:hypothetical protein
MHTVGGPDTVTGGWVHLAGVLAEEGGSHVMRLYVNGELAATGGAGGYLAGEPGETLQVGADNNSNVGEYETPFAFNGTVDEVCVYHRALAGAEVAAHHAAPGDIDTGDAALVLYLSFDAGDAADGSGNGHDGSVLGAVPTPGVSGTALAFVNQSESMHWTYDGPFHVRGMVKVGGTLFIAGVPDVVDTEHAFDHFADRRVQANLRLQSHAHRGGRGGLMYAVDAATGQTLVRRNLPVEPVWDGLISAGDRLYMATLDGRVVCYEGP